MTTMIDRFANEYFDYNGIGQQRRRDMLRNLRAFELHAGVPIEQATADHFESFLRNELATGKLPTTVKFIAGTIRPFFKWAWRREVIAADHYMRVFDVPMPALQANAGLPRPYDRRELDKFWQALDDTWPLLTRRSTWDRWQAGRARWPRIWRHAMRLQIDCAVHLALHCGLRKHEIRSLEIDHFHYDNEYVVVMEGKGGRYREVPHTDGSRAATAAWIEMRSFIAKHDSPWMVLTPTATANSIIPSDPFNPMSQSRFERLLHFVPGAARGDDHWEFHRFRHTCATEWLRAGMPIEQVSRLVGHATISQTLVYAKIVKTDIQREAERHAARFERAVGRREAA